MKVRAAFWARMGQMRNPNPEIAKIRIVHEDMPAIFSFLNALHDAGERKAIRQPTPDPPEFYVSPSVRDADFYRRDSKDESTSD